MLSEPELPVGRCRNVSTSLVIRKRDNGPALAAVCRARDFAERCGDDADEPVVEIECVRRGEWQYAEGPVFSSIGGTIDPGGVPRGAIVKRPKPDVALSPGCRASETAELRSGLVRRSCSPRPVEAAIGGGDDCPASVNGVAEANGAVGAQPVKAVEETSVLTEHFLPRATPVGSAKDPRGVAGGERVAGPGIMSRRSDKCSIRREGSKRCRSLARDPDVLRRQPRSSSVGSAKHGSVYAKHPACISADGGNEPECVGVMLELNPPFSVSGSRCTEDEGERYSKAGDSRENPKETH